MIPSFDTHWKELNLSGTAKSSCLEFQLTRIALLFCDYSCGPPPLTSLSVDLVTLSIVACCLLRVTSQYISKLENDQVVRHSTFCKPPSEYHCCCVRGDVIALPENPCPHVITHENQGPQFIEVSNQHAVSCVFGLQVCFPDPGLNILKTLFCSWLKMVGSNIFVIYVISGMCFIRSKQKEMFLQSYAIGW